MDPFTVISTAMWLFLVTPTAITLGWKLHARRSYNYKKRWQEALALLQQERSGTAQLAVADAQIVLKNPWKVKVETKGIYTWVTVTDGKKSIPIKNIWVEAFYYENNLAKAVNAGEKRAKQLNRVGAT